MRTLLKSLLCAAACLVAAAPAASAATGHFNDPWALAADGAGDVYVVSSKGAYVDEIKPGYAITKLNLSNLTYPISIAVDPERQHIFVGNWNGTGDVTEYGANGGYEGTITANAGYPESIAADAFDDLYLSAFSGVAIDDPDGNSITSDAYSPPGGAQVLSLTLSGPDLLAFFDDGAAIGNASFVLRGSTLATQSPSVYAPDPTASACASPSQCWVVDSAHDAVETENYGDGFVGSGMVDLPYSPGGIAYDPVHNRLYISDPNQNKVYVYDPSSFAVLKTLS